MGRQPCCDKVGMKKGPWTAEEDQKLVAFLLTNGHCCWRAVPKLAGLLRCGKSCRLRWTNYIRPDLKRGLLSEEEETTVIDLHEQLGNRWSKIASHLPGRTDNEIKNIWNTHIKKKLKKMGIDPVTHKPLHQSAAGPPALHPQEEKATSGVAMATTAAGIVAGDDDVLGNEAFSTHDHEVPTAVHLLDDTAEPTPARNNGGIINISYCSPESSSSSSSSSSCYSASAATTASSSGGSSSIVDFDWQEWLEWPETSMLLDDVVSMPGPWEFEDPFVNHQMVALFDQRSTW